MMEELTNCEKEEDFIFHMDVINGKSFDNKEVMHQRFSLVYVESGSGIATLDDKSVAYMAPCVFCVNEEEHIVISEMKENSIRVMLLHPDVINSSLNFESVRNLPEGSALTVSQDRWLFRLFTTREKDYIGKFNLGPVSAKKISNLYDNCYELICVLQCENWPCMSRSYLLWLLFLLENLYSMGEYSNEQMLGKVDDKLNQILLYIYNNYDKKITVTEITDKYLISRTTLAKMFQENVGETFLTYLNKLRINVASTILRDTLLPVNEIMFRVGFTDTVHFYRTFKKYTGYTPTEYREKFGWL